MTKTINFCGDSFCADHGKDSWTVQLASILDATVQGFGKDGAAHEHAIKSFDPKVDITIFCWTEPHRIYHPTASLNQASCVQYRATNPIFEAGYQFYKYLHESNYYVDRQTRDLYWFDREVLSEYKGQSISLWSFQKTYQFKHSCNFSLPPLKSLSNRAQGKINHMNESMNEMLAKKIFNYIRSLNG